MQLISDDYRQEQANLHASNSNYGVASLNFGGLVSGIVDVVKADTLLDYGCGSKRSLMSVLAPSRDIVYLGYDPAIPEFSRKEPCDLVVCIDVLEHVEPELLDNVLDDLMMLTKGWAFLTVHTKQAAKVLSDGRNAHLIQKPASWWLPKLMQRWELQKFDRTTAGFNVLMKI